MYKKWCVGVQRSLPIHWNWVQKPISAISKLVSNTRCYVYCITPELDVLLLGYVQCRTTLKLTMVWTGCANKLALSWRRFMWITEGFYLVHRATKSNILAKTTGVHYPKFLELMTQMCRVIRQANGVFIRKKRSEKYIFSVLSASLIGFLQSCQLLKQLYCSEVPHSGIALSLTRFTVSLRLHEHTNI